jgi:hypothetical protein
LAGLEQVAFPLIDRTLRSTNADGGPEWICSDGLAPVVDRRAAGTTKPDRSPFFGRCADDEAKADFVRVPFLEK